MVYVVSASMAAMNAHLPNHRHILLLLQQALGCDLAGPDATLPPLVADFPCIADNKVSHALKMLGLYKSAYA